MEHKQFISDDLSLSPRSNQGFQADRFTKKTNQLNIPDTILENCSAEMSGDSLKMEARKLMTDSFNSEDKENIFCNQQVACNDSLNNSTNIAIDNSYIRQCERKLLEISNVEDERSNEVDNKSLVNSQLLKVSRKYNETISTPPSLLRKEISMLRTEMAEAHEFHDFEIQLLKEEKFLNEVDTENNAELLEKYSTLMELYTALKASYDEYRRAQEKIGREFQSKTADCLESLCSQIEASDGSLNFSSASFVSFNGGIRSSTMMEDVSEVEATVMHEATVLANDPLSITADGGFKTPLQTPLKSAKKLFPQELNSTLTANTETHLDEENNIHLLNLETALYDKIKEVKDLEQRLFKVEDMSVVLQNEFERINSVYAMENNTLKENLSAKTDQLNELTQKLFTEIISLNPSLRESLIDASGKKLLLVFIETIMENCKKIKGDDTGSTVEYLQNQLENSRKECEKLESTVLTRDEEIRMLQSHLSNVRQTREDLASAKEALSDVEARLTLEEAQKKAAENRCAELEASIQKLNEDINASEKIRAELQSQLSSAEEEKSEMKKETFNFKELYEGLQLQLSETEKLLKSNESEMIALKENLAKADDTIEQLKSQLQMVEEEKSGLLSRESDTNSMKESLDAANERIEQLKSQLEMVEDEKSGLLSKESEMNALKESLETANETIEKLKSQLEMVEAGKSGFSRAESELSSMKESLATANERIDQLKSQLEMVEAEKSGLLRAESELSLMKESLETANEKIEQLKSQLEMVEEEKSGLLSKISEMNALKESLEAANEKIEELKSQLQMVEEEKSGLLSKESELNSLKESLEKAETVTEELKAQLKMVEEEKSSLLSVESEMNSLKESLERANETINQLQSELKAVEEVKSGLMSKESEVNTLKESLETANETIEHLKSQLQTLEEEKSGLLSKESKLNLLKESLATAESFTEELKSQLKILEEEKSGLQEANQKLQEEIRELKESVDNEIEGLMQRISDSDKFVEELKAEVESAKNCQELEELKSNLQMESQSKEEFIKEVEEHKIARDAAESEIKGLKQQILDLGEETERLKKTLEAAEEERMVGESRVKESQNEIDGLIREKQDLVEVTERLAEKLENLEKNNQNVMDAIAEVRTHLDMVDGTIGDVQFVLPVDRIAKLIEKVLPASTETKDSNILTEFVETITKTCKTVQNELIKNFDIKKSELENKNQTEIENLQAHIQSLNVQNNENEDALTRTKHELTQASETILNLKSQLSSSEVEKTEIELRIRNLEENIITLRTEIETKEAIIKGLDELKIVREKIETENGDLKRRILESEEVIVSLKRNLEAANEEQLVRMKHSETEMEQLKKEKESLTGLTEKCERLEKVEGENEDLKRQIVELAEEIERLKKILEEAEEGKMVRESRIKESQNEIDGLKKEKQDLVEVTERLAEKLENLEKNNQTVVEVIADVRTHLVDGGIGDVPSYLPSDIVTELIEKALPESEDTNGTNILTEFMETIKTVQNELMRTLNSQKSEWETQKENLQEQIQTLNVKETENEDALTRTKHELTEADETIQKLKSQLSSTEAEKTEIELLVRKLEENTLNLQAEIDTKKEGLDRKEKIEMENVALKQQILELEVEIARLKEIQEAKEALSKEVEVYKLSVETAENEVKDLKQQILDSGEEVERLKKILETTEEEQLVKESRIKESRDEIDVLKKQKEDLIEVTERLTEKLEGLEKNNQKVMDVIAEIRIHLDALEIGDVTSDLPGDRITKLMEKLLPDSEDSKETNIFSEFVGTIIKTCKGIQNELIKSFNSKNSEWETKKQTEIENLQEQIKSLQDKTNENEDALTRTKHELTEADETIQKLKSQLSSTEIEKTEIELLVRKLEENTLNLQAEIDGKEEELRIMREKIENENGDLKKQILELGEEIERLKKILEEAEEDQLVRETRIKDSRNEIDVLKKEKDDLMEVNERLTEKLESLEKNNQNVMDAIADVRTHLDAETGEEQSDLPGDRITKLIEKVLPDSTETKDSNILTEFVETIVKTCKGVQNELIKSFDIKKSELENKNQAEIENLQAQIQTLNVKNNENEDALTRTKHELTEADEAIVKLKSQLSSTEVQKVEIELRVRKLEENTVNLQAEIDTKETIIKGLDELKIAREKIETENGDLKRQILESEEVIVSLKRKLEVVKEEQLAREAKMKESETEMEQLKKEKESLTDLTERFEDLEKKNKNLTDVFLEVQTHLDMPENTLSKVLSGKLDVSKSFGERINNLVKTQTEGLKSENKHLKLGNDNLKEKVKQLTQLIREASTEAKEELSNLNSSLSSSSLISRSKASRKSDLCARRLDKLEEINHNLTELITRMLSMTEFPDSDKLKLYSVRDFPGVMKKVVAHMNGLAEKLSEVKEENAQLDEECETYANIIKDLKKEAATVWKTNKEKTEEMEAEIGRLKEEKSRLENEKVDLVAKISKLDAEIKKLKSCKSEGAPHSCACGSDSKKINELKRTILVKEQKLLELQDLESQTSSYKSQIEYLKNALEREKKKTVEEKDKNKKLQNELNEATKNQKTEEKKGDENQVLDELRMRGSLCGGIVQEFVDKEKMRKLSKDIGILKELCRARYAEIKRLEAVNASLRNNTPKNSNQMDSPIRTRGYNTRSKVQPRDLWKSELTGKENSAV